LQDKIFYERIEERYLSLSRQINKFIQWVEKKLNNFPKPDTNNQLFKLIMQPEPETKSEIGNLKPVT